MAGTVIFPRVRRLSDRGAREHRFLTDVAQRRGIIPAHSFTRRGQAMRPGHLCAHRCSQSTYLEAMLGGRWKSAPPLIEFYPPFGYLLNEISSRIFFFHRQFRVFVAGEVEDTRAPWWPINILPRSETIAYRSLNRRKLCQEWIVYVRNLYGSDFRDFCSFSFFFLRIESNF